MEERLSARELQEGDLVYSEQFGGCGLIAQPVKSGDWYLECEFVWYPKEERFWLSESLAIDDVRKPTFEEMNEFMRHYSEMTNGWRTETMFVGNIKEKLYDIVEELKANGF